MDIRKDISGRNQSLCFFDISLHIFFWFSPG